MNPILEFIKDYWALISGIAIMLFTLIKFLINITNRLTNTENKLASTENTLIEHNKLDLKIAEDLAVVTDQTRKDLTALIDRNREATEKSHFNMQLQLQTIGEDLAVVKNNINLIITNKIKI